MTFGFGPVVDGDPDLALEMIRRGANINDTAVYISHDESALMHSIQIRICESYKELFQTEFTDVSLELIKLGCDIEWKDENQKTALMVAVQVGDKEVGLALLQKGCLLNQTNTSGDNALTIAVDFKDPDFA